MSKRSIAGLLVAAMAFLVPVTMSASSHREAPLISEDPSVDNTDVYVFRSPDSPNTVTIIANYIPFEEPAGGPNFNKFTDNGIYQIHIDNNGDAQDDIIYEFKFTTTVTNPATFLYNTGPVTSLASENLNVRQFYTVTRIDGSGNRTQLGGSFEVAPANIGPRSTPNYEANLAVPAIGTLPDGGKVFAGPRDDPFFVDLGSVFDLLALRPIQGLHLIPTPGNTTGVDGLKGYNVHSIALQIPITDVTSDGSMPSSMSSPDAVIGVWASASRPKVTITAGASRQNVGGYTQVSRLGMPLVNEAVMSRKFKDIFNSSQPSGDLNLFTTVDEFKQLILNPELGRLIPVLYPGVTVPPAPRNDIVEVFLTGVPGLNQPPNVVPAEMLRLNLATPVSATPNPLGVIAGDNQGFPNGRRLADDVVDIELRVVAGVLVNGFNIAPNNALTDGVDANDAPFQTSFPYLATPWQGYESIPHGGTAQ